MGIRGSRPTGMGSHHSGGGNIGGSSWNLGNLNIGHHHHRFLWI